MRTIAILLFLLILMLFCSCSSYSKGGYEFDPGETLTPEMLESVFADGTTPAPDTSEPEETTPMHIDENTEVYFTDSGTKYHLFSDCGSLSNSKNIKTAKLSEAIENKKEECCKHCEKRVGLAPKEE